MLSPIQQPFINCGTIGVTLTIAMLGLSFANVAFDVNFA